jgi:3,4-dihydroxy 2-butanone 4-phosphate synthase
MTCNKTSTVSACSKVAVAINSLRDGSGVLVIDNEDRENEADLIFPAESITERQMAMLIRECSGIVCLCLTEAKIHSLGLPMMVSHNTSKFKTAFTISIEAATGVTTGVSAADRITTIRTAIAENATPEHLCSPGHVFPLKACDGGVLEREGHTEAAVDIVRLTGFKPFAVLCELTNPDGTMARLPEIISFSHKHNIPILSIRDLIEYRRSILL